MTKKAENVAGWSLRRVSTNDQQTLPMQNRVLRKYAGRRGWIVAMEVPEVAPVRSDEKLANN